MMIKNANLFLNTKNIFKINFKHNSSLPPVTFNKFSFKHFASKVEIEEKLNKSLKIENLEVIDLSGSCGTSFMIKIKSPDFKGKTLISQQRLIYDILKEELKDIHALQLKTES
jgi:stress-induced morphogen